MSDDAKREGLLPCPFCGGESALVNGTDGESRQPIYKAYCRGCQIRQVKRFNSADAIAAWNRRDNSALEASNKALRCWEWCVQHNDFPHFIRQIHPEVKPLGWRLSLQTPPNGVTVDAEDWPYYPTAVAAVEAAMRALAPALLDGKEKS